MLRRQYLGHHIFCLISWRLVDWWKLYLRCWFSVTQTLTWIYVCRSVTYISWSSNFGLYLEDCLINKCHNCDIGSIWCKDLLIKCMWVSDLHFMVQWLYLYWFSVSHTLTWNYVCRSVIYISWSSDFALYLEDYLMDRCHNWNIGSMWCKDVPHKMYIYVVQWPTFHDPVILSYILKTFWWRNVVLKILIHCNIKFDLQMYK